jgi:hypothetical protein
MMNLLNITPQQLFDFILIALGLGLIVSLFLIGLVVIFVKRINIPENADFITALRATPLTVVIVLDLLDFFLDFLSAPFAWVLLGYLGLKPLRTVTVIESFIPFSQFVPTMTVAWVIARLIKREDLPILHDPRRREIS